MFNVIGKTVIAFVFVLLLALLMAPNALAAGISPSAILASVRYLPDSAKELTVAKPPKVTLNQMPIIHDDVWIADVQHSLRPSNNSDSPKAACCGNS